MYVQRHVVDVVTATGGTVTAFSPLITGEIGSITYVKDGTTPYTSTVDFTVTLEATGEGLWTEANVSASKTVYPRAAVHDAVGAAALYAAGGTGVRDRIPAGADRVKIALVQGGATKTGRFHIVVV